MKKTVITYGLISGVLISLMMIVPILASKENDFHGGYLIGYASMVLAFIVIYFAMASYRKNVGDGEIKYLRALSIGLLVTLIASVLYAITWVFLCPPDFMDKYAAYAIAKMKTDGASAEKINNAITEMNGYKELYKNPITMGLFTILEPLPVGIIISLISAYLVRLKKKPTSANDLMA